MKLKFRFAESENKGGIDVKLEAAFAKVTKTVYDHGGECDYSSDYDDSESETEPV